MKKVCDLSVIKIQPQESIEIFHGNVDNGYHNYGSDWWKNRNCPYAYKYIKSDSLYPSQYFGGNIGHPNDRVGSDLYQYMQEVFMKVHGRKIDSVLELGTGAGEITKQFHKNGLDYIAVEGTTAGTAALKSIGIDPNRILNLDIRKMPMNLGRKFDIVMCTEIIEHVEPFFSSRVVEICTNHANSVWFSSVEPNIIRPHYHHCNESPIGAWDNIFAFMGHNSFVALNGLHSRATRMYMKGTE